MSYLKIEWFNSVDYGSVLYQDGFKNRIYLDVELERPDYNVTIESDVNGDNQEIPKFRKWEKVYKFISWMQEDLVDAFTFMSTVDTIEVTPPTGETFIVQSGSMKVEPEWEEAGCLAKVTVSFVTDYAVAGTCTENMDTDCLCTDSVYTINSLITYANMLLQPCAAIYYLAYTAENIANKRYTGKIYTCVGGGSGTWTEQIVSVNECVEDLAPATTWLYDGTYWHLMPGYIISTSYAAPNLTITGFAPDGTFATVWIDNGPGGSWVDYGDYISQDLETGISISIGTSGTFHLKLEIWNHTCDYGDTATEHIIIP